MSLSTLYPNLSPALLLDFAGTKQLDPRITFTRASTATYYNGVTTAKAEENLLLQSQDFTTTWLNDNTADTANTTTAPDGTSTADTLRENAATSAHTIFQNITAISGQSYTFSVFVKRNGRDVQLCFGNGDVTGNPYANFDLTAGTVATTSGSITATISPAGNSWYRCSVTSTASVSTDFGSVVALIDSLAATRAPSYTGDNTSGVFLWGAQLEQRSAVTAYTPTTTQPITNYIPVLLTAQNNIPRFEHNPVTGESLGLEIEEQRTNICLQSEDFSTTWTNTASSEQINTIVSPAGTLTGDKLVEDGTNAAHFISQIIATTSNVTFAASIYAKAAEITTFVLRIRDQNNNANLVQATFNLANGTMTGASNSGTGTGAAGSITSVGNGWYRCTVTGNPNGTGNTDFNLRLQDGNAYQGNGYSGIFIWGAQLEQGAFPTSYIPTVASQVTRSADSASMTGTNFSSWYNQAEGSFYSEYAASATAYNGGVLAASDGTFNNRIIIRGMTPISNSATIGAANAVTQWNDGFTAQTTAPTKWAIAYKFNDIALTRNAVAPLNDTSAIIPTVNQLRIGADGDGSFPLNGTIKKLAYYPARLSNTQLQALTTV